jgi:hypothetical protein
MVAWHLDTTPGKVPRRQQLYSILLVFRTGIDQRGMKTRMTHDSSRSLPELGEAENMGL